MEDIFEGAKAAGAEQVGDVVHGSGPSVPLLSPGPAAEWACCCLLLLCRPAACCRLLLSPVLAAAFCCLGL